MPSVIPKPRVLIGMSGGIDSSVSVHLLKQSGFEVTGLTLLTSYVSRDSVDLAARAADNLGIELIIKDLSRTFEEKVVEPFIKGYASGLTPNPCVVCNPSFKFQELLTEADRIGADRIATGHYAGVIVAGGSHFITRSGSGKNDQSYFLYRLPEEIRSWLVLPLGAFTKDEVRKIAGEIGLDYSKVKGSQEACFVTGDLRKWFDGRVPGMLCEGPAFDMDGNRIGTHSGSVGLTIGQRKGHGISAGKRSYITRIDHRHNAIYLGDREDCLSSVVEAEDVVFSSATKDGVMAGMHLSVRTRSSMEPKPAHVRYSSGKLVATFEEPVWASAQGQSMVCYDGDMIACGGIII